MYDAIDDPYCYPGTPVLRNKLDLHDQAALEAFEADAVRLRGEEPLPRGRLSVTHYCAVHRHLFQDVYPWAGRFRSVRIAKGGSMFCYPEHIPSQMAQAFGDLRRQGFLYGLGREEFVAGAAEFLAVLNAIHPFREGNGRTQMVFMALVADQAGHPFDLDRLDVEEFLPAMVASFHGDLAPLRHQLDVVTRKQPS